jgi:uncharacterized protein (TIGR01244 family)
MANYRELGDGIFIGPQPTGQDLNEARQQGVRTVIDMRMPSETAIPNADLVRKNGLAYVNIPVNKAALSERQVDEISAALRQNEGPFLVHCATGARAALLLALSRAKQHGWTAERTFSEAEAMGFNLQGSPDFAAFVRQTAGG